MANISITMYNRVEQVIWVHWGNIVEVTTGVHIAECKVVGAHILKMWHLIEWLLHTYSTIQQPGTGHNSTMLSALQICLPGCLTSQADHMAEEMEELVVGNVHSLLILFIIDPFHS